MKLFHEPAREVPVSREAEVVVVGGGPAGLAAAIASGRLGARTVLVERFGYLGGTATASLMACINGFRNQVESGSSASLGVLPPVAEGQLRSNVAPSARVPREPEAPQTVRGIAEEIILRLKELGGLGRSPYKQKSYPTLPGQLEYSYAIDTEKFKYVTLKMCVEAGVDIMFHTYFSLPVVEGNAVRGAIVENKSGRQALLARVVVDATGDGDVAARSGAPYWQTRGDEAPRLTDSLMYRVEFGAKRPEGTFACDFGRNAVVWGPGVEPMDGADGDALARAEADARLRVYEDFAEKQARNPELADAKVVETPPLLGVRQTRFIEGDYTLTAEDAIQGRRFDDVVAISSCPIIHYYGYRRYLEHEGYDIPYRSLLPKGVENLLVAGRCISSEQQPYESHRAMAPIMAIGQAAGAAAALSAKQGVTPRQLNVADLQRALVAQGAELRR